MIFRTSAIILSLVLVVGYQLLRSQDKPSSSGFDLVDKTGNIRKPFDYRDHYQALGTFTVLDPNGDQMHLTYASPGTAEYYRNDPPLTRLQDRVWPKAHEAAVKKLRDEYRRYGRESEYAS